MPKVGTVELARLKFFKRLEKAGINEIEILEEVLHNPETPPKVKADIALKIMYLRVPAPPKSVEKAPVNRKNEAPSLEFVDEAPIDVPSLKYEAQDNN